MIYLLTYYHPVSFGPRAWNNLYELIESDLLYLKASIT